MPPYLIPLRLSVYPAAATRFLASFFLFTLSGLNNIVIATEKRFLKLKRRIIFTDDIITLSQFSVINWFTILVFSFRILRLIFFCLLSINKTSLDFIGGGAYIGSA